jgi:pyridoxine 5-phosphate synthase
VRGVFNLEMAAVPEMLQIALAVRPDFCTLVPERRQERTTEGGLDVRGRRAEVEAIARPLVAAGIGVSFFVDPDPAVVQASAALGATTIELHTGDYCRAPLGSPEARNQLGRLALAGRAVVDAGLRLAAGHGLDQGNVGPVAALPNLEELNIGHGLIARAVLVGLERAVADLRAAIAAGAGPS